MPSVPMKFRDTRGNKFAYKAGYGDGYGGKPDRVSIRAEEVRDAYVAGFTMGQNDHHKRWPQLYEEADNQSFN